MHRAYVYIFVCLYYLTLNIPNPRRSTDSSVITHALLTCKLLIMFVGKSTVIKLL